MHDEWESLGVAGPTIVVSHPEKSPQERPHIFVVGGT